VAHLALFSFSAGMTPEQQQALICGQREPEALADAPPEPEAEAPAEAPPAKPKRRARTDRGEFQADDPTTPAVNEAHEHEREN